MQRNVALAALLRQLQSLQQATFSAPPTRLQQFLSSVPRVAASGHQKSSTHLLKTRPHDMARLLCMPKPLLPPNRKDSRYKTATPTLLGSSHVVLEYSGDDGDTERERVTAPLLNVCSVPAGVPVDEMDEWTSAQDATPPAFISFSPNRCIRNEHPLDSQTIFELQQKLQLGDEQVSATARYSNNANAADRRRCTTCPADVPFLPSRPNAHLAPCLFDRCLCEIELRGGDVVLACYRAQFGRFCVARQRKASDGGGGSGGDHSTIDWSRPRVLSSEDEAEARALEERTDMGTDDLVSVSPLEVTHIRGPVVRRLLDPDADNTAQHAKRCRVQHPARPCTPADDLLLCGTPIAGRPPIADRRWSRSPSRVVLASRSSRRRRREWRRARRRGRCGPTRSRGGGPFPTCRP